jgi:hypothetical protein
VRENGATLAGAIRHVHERIRDHVVFACERSTLADLSRVARDAAGDTLYAVDRVSEELLVGLFAEVVAPLGSFVLIAEGLDHGEIVLPAGRRAADADWRIIVDPIDGTRGLMYQKRSAWILTGAAPNRGPATTLADIEVAVQTEIPLVKQHLSDVLWAAGGEVGAERFNRLTGERHALHLRPSREPTIEGGFATVTRFFPGARGELGSLDDQIARAAAGPIRQGKARCFEDQYISTGGQLYELVAGHDRFVADLRPLMEGVLAGRGEALGLCCHPYDICTELIARQMGVIVTDAAGHRLACPLDLDTEVAWVGYANEQIRTQVEPVLKSALAERGLLSAE